MSPLPPPPPVLPEWRLPASPEQIREQASAHMQAWDDWREKVFWQVRQEAHEAAELGGLCHAGDAQNILGVTPQRVSQLRSRWRPGPRGTVSLSDVKDHLRARPGRPSKAKPCEVVAPEPCFVAQKTGKLQEKTLEDPAPRGKEIPVAKKKTLVPRSSAAKEIPTMIKDLGPGDAWRLPGQARVWRWSHRTKLGLTYGTHPSRATPRPFLPEERVERIT